MATLSTGFDRTENFELGVKTSFADQRITLNTASIELTGEYSNICHPLYGLHYRNECGKAVSEGVEVEIQTLLADSVRLDFSASYGEATLDETNSLGEKGDNLPGSADLI